MKALVSTQCAKVRWFRAISAGLSAVLFLATGIAFANTAGAVDTLKSFTAVNPTGGATFSGIGDTWNRTLKGALKDTRSDNHCARLRYAFLFDDGHIEANQVNNCSGSGQTISIAASGNGPSRVYQIHVRMCLYRAGIESDCTSTANTVIVSQCPTEGNFDLKVMQGFARNNDDHVGIIRWRDSAGRCHTERKGVGTGARYQLHDENVCSNWAPDGIWVTNGGTPSGSGFWPNGHDDLAGRKEWDLAYLSDLDGNTRPIGYCGGIARTAPGNIAIHANPANSTTPNNRYSLGCFKFTNGDLDRFQQLWAAAGSPRFKVYVYRV